MDLTAEEVAYARGLGRTIVHLRKRRRLSQADLARAAGLAQPDISHIERGLIRADSLALRRMAAAFEVTLPDLMAQVEVATQAPEPGKGERRAGRLPLPPEKRRTDIYWVRLNNEERRLLQQLSGTLQILRSADLFRDGLRALWEEQLRLRGSSVATNKTPL